MRAIKTLFLCLTAGLASLALADAPFNADHYAQDAGARSTLALEGEAGEYFLVASSMQLEN